MYKVVQETWLTKLVATFGDHALVSIVTNIYASGFFKVCLVFFLSLAFVNLGIGIHRRQLSEKAIFAALVFLLIYPSKGKPIAYRLVDSLGTATRYVFESGVNAVISNSKLHSERSNMPPGIVLEMVIMSATTGVKDQKTRALIYGFVVNCLPNALTTKGAKASFDDLFSYETTYTQDSVTGMSTLAFRDPILDTRALENDNSYHTFRPDKNCYDGLKDMRTALAGHQEESSYLVDRTLMADDDPSESKSLDQWFRNWQATTPHFQRFARNLQAAYAAAYEKSTLISTHGWDLNDPSGSWWQGTSTDASLRELLLSESATTEFGYRLSDFKNILANTTGQRWAFSLGASLKDLKERIELLPYYTAAIKLLLKIIFPFVLFTFFLHTFRFFFLWAGAWTATLLIPSIISASRAIGNSILLSKLGITNLANAEGYKTLAHGVDLSVAKHFLADFTPLAYALVEQEIAIIKVLSGCMLVGGWLAGGGANGFVSWITNSIQGTLVGGTTSMAARSAGSKALAPLAGATLAGPPGALIAGSGLGLAYGARRVVDGIRSGKITLPRRST